MPPRRSPSDQQRQQRRAAAPRRSRPARRPGRRGSARGAPCRRPRAPPPARRRRGSRSAPRPAARTRLRAAGEQRRSEPRAERGAADEAGERKRAGDQATLVADSGQREREGRMMPTSTSVAFIESAPARGSSFRPGAATTLSRRGSRVAHAARRDSQSYRRDRAGLSTQRATERRRRILTRAIPLVVVLPRRHSPSGSVVAAEPVAPGGPAVPRRLGARRLRRDARRAHPRGPRGVPAGALQALYTDAAEAATIDVITVDEVREGDDTARRPGEHRTHAFGNLRGELALPIADGQGGLDPEPRLPGPRPGGAAQSPHARPGGPRFSPPIEPRSPRARPPRARLDAAAVAVVGETGTPTRAQARELALLGFPPGSLTGISGLELAWNDASRASPAVSSSRSRRRRRASRRRARARLQRAGARRAGEDDDRPRPPGGGGYRARQPFRRRRRARHPQG